MNLKNIEYFLEVTKDLNITRTSARLYISQQALSNQIAKLESELGVLLFERSPQLSLTEAGLAFKRAALQVVDIHRQLIQEIGDISCNEKGEIRVGISFTRGLAIMPKVLPEFHRLHPMVKVTLVEGTSIAIEENLSTGLVDIALINAPTRLENTVVVEVGSEPLYLAVPKAIMEQNFAGRMEETVRSFQWGVSIGEFSDAPFIQYDPKEHLRRLMDKLFAENKMKPFMVAQTRSFHTALAFARRGLAVAVIPKYMLTSYTVSPDVFVDTKSETYFFPIASQSDPEKLVIAYSSKRYLSVPAKELIELILAELSGNLDPAGT